MSSPFAGSDVSWLAVDADDHVAWLVVNDSGTVPRALWAKPERLFRQEPALAAWIERRGHAFAFGSDEMWRSAAACGLFAYDWNRIARVYELLARPATPILSGELSVVPPPIRLSGVRFAGSTRLSASDIEGGA